jgi:hypothetical protein
VAECTAPIRAAARGIGGIWKSKQTGKPTAEQDKTSGGAVRVLGGYWGIEQNKKQQRVVSVYVGVCGKPDGGHGRTSNKPGCLGTSGASACGQCRHNQGRETQIQMYPVGIISYRRVLSVARSCAREHAYAEAVTTGAGVADSGTAGVSVAGSRLPLVSGTEAASVVAGVFSVAATSLVGRGGAVDSSWAGEVEPLADRLTRRNRPPSLPLVGFFPSPSVTSASDVAPSFFSFLPEMVPKKDCRRFSLAGSGVAAVTVVVVAGTGAVAAASAGAAVSTLVETGSS